MASIDTKLKDCIMNLKLLAFDFDGVFTNNMVYVSQDGTEMVRCNRSDGLGLTRLRELGVPMIIISTETNPVVSARAAKLKMECVQGCGDKRAALDDIMRERGITPDQVAFMGNDINDIPCLSYVGLPIVVADAYDAVVPLAIYQTKARGGCGAVREVCDLIESVLCEVESANA